MQRELVIPAEISNKLELAPKFALRDVKTLMLFLFNHSKVYRSQETWARELGLKSKASISNYLNGKQNISLDNAIELQRLSGFVAILQYMAAKLGFDLVPSKKSEIDSLRAQADALEAQVGG